MPSEVNLVCFDENCLVERFEILLLKGAHSEIYNLLCLCFSSFKVLFSLTCPMSLLSFVFKLEDWERFYLQMLW